MLSVKFHNPDFPDDIVFDIGGIAVPNGSSVEVDDEAELKFYATHGKILKDYFKDNKQVEISGTTEITSADKDKYNIGDEEASTLTLVDPEIGDPTIPEPEDDEDAVKEDEA